MGEEHAEQQGERRQRLLAARQQRHDLQALARRARHDLQAGGQRILGFGELQVRPAAAEEAHEELLEVRSEEHTSELQSLMRISYAVFCLKKKKQNDHNK